MTGQRPRTGAHAAHPALARMPVIRMNAQYKKIRPAALSRQILALTGRLKPSPPPNSRHRSNPP